MKSSDACACQSGSDAGTCLYERVHKLEQSLSSSKLYFLLVTLFNIVIFTMTFVYVVSNQHAIPCDVVSVPKSNTQHSTYTAPMSAADDELKFREKRDTSGANDTNHMNIFEILFRTQVSVMKKYCINATQICLPGAKGATGSTGPRGLKGDAGFNGSNGNVGSKGETGDLGDKGQKGDTGLNGSNGVKGKKGNKGEAGINGLKGEVGDIGPVGQRGAGDKGEIGQKGDTGTNGVDGAQGPKGDRGQDVIGATGAKGDTGRKGDVGNKGEPGVDAIKGEKGQKGSQLKVCCGTIIYEPGAQICCDDGTTCEVVNKGFNCYDNMKITNTN